jgi:phosphoribosylglycinamide formyltransferase 1
VLTCCVLISGSGSNLAALLEAADFADAPFRIIAVGSDTDAPGLEHAQSRGIPTFVVSPSAFDSRVAWGEELIQAIATYSPDLVVCAGFMRILPANVVQAFSPNLINMHPALLPMYPGAHAVRDALADGAVVTGASIHVVDEGVDTGPVIAQEQVDIVPDDTESSLHERIKVVERALIVQTVTRIATNQITLEEFTRP